jgi:hypothetical protein
VKNVFDFGLYLAYVRAMKQSAFVTVPLSEAKTYLGRLLERAARGETIYIRRGEQRFLIQPTAEIDPIPIRPAGYFENAYSKAEIRADNILAKKSVVRAPKDLE